METKLEFRNLNIVAGGRPVLRDLSFAIPAGTILSVIGPAHSGKTTLLRAANRLLDTEPLFRRTGDILLDGREVRQLDTDLVRRRIGLIFATPIPLPGTIFDNVAYGPRLRGRRSRARLAAIVESALRSAFLWDEVKDRLHSSALRLSGGQQQRLCIARTIAVNPEVIMMDEPTSGLDPISTAQVESAMRQLKDRYTFILVTNNVKQAARVSDTVVFLLGGELVELGDAEQIFTRPRDQRTDDYVSGRIG
jgi:phosphate transport system ATP-binding protein